MQAPSGRLYRIVLLMKQQEIKRTSLIAIASVICALSSIGLSILWALLVILGLDIGAVLTNGFYLSYAAGILSILAICIITIRRRVLKGYLYAILALILAAPFIILDYGIELQVKVREKQKKEYTALYNMELLATELKKYAQSNDGNLPNAENWCDVLMAQNPELTTDNFRHPMAELLSLKGKCHIAFNSNLGGKRLSKISPDTVLLFEADGDFNLNGTAPLLRSRYNPKRFIRMLFVDGSTAEYWYKEKAIRRFKSELGGAYMYYEKPKWTP